MGIPELYDPDRSSSRLTQAEAATLYELGTRPAIVHLCPTPANEWPANYPDEMWRARGHNGQLAFGGKLVPEWHVRDLADAMRESFTTNESLWGTGLVFIHQIRGVKHSTTHRPDAESAAAAMTLFLEKNHLPLAAVTRDGDSWYADLALEISSTEGNCLAWRTDSHHRIVRHILQLTTEEALRITKPGSSLYARDLISHLPAVSGCRITPGMTGGRYQAAYIQMYLTDKSLTYRPDGRHHGKFIEAKDLLDGKGSTFITGLCNVYNNAIDTCSSHCRIEARVPLVFANSVMLDIPERLIRRSIISVVRHGGK